MSERTPLLNDGVLESSVNSTLVEKQQLRQKGVDGALATDTYPVESARWWVLGWFSYIAALQSLLWFTYSSVPDHSKHFLHVGDNTLLLFLNEGPIAFCCTVWYANWLLTRESGTGLRDSVVTAAILCFLGATIRCIPLIQDVPHSVGLGLIHCAQVLNAAAAPFVVASVSVLSLEWFAESERNTATAIGNVASAAGRAIGFLLGPAVVKHADDLTRLLLIEVVLATVPLLAVLVFYPVRPAEPPSWAAVNLERSRTAGTSNSSKGWVLRRELVHVFQNPAFIAITIAGGINMGVYGMWSGVLPQVLPSAWGDTLAGYFGLGNTLAGIVGGILAGLFTDMRSLQRRLKTIMITALLGAGVFFSVFAVTLPPLSSSEFKPLASSRYGLLAVCTAAGLLRGATDPLFFEVAADTVYPRSAGTAGSVLTFGYHIALVISLSIPATALNDWALTTMAGTMFVCTVIVACVPIRYHRR